MEEYINHKKMEELLSKFQNGKEKYRNSPIFHSIVQSLIRNNDPINVIEQLLTIIEDQQKVIEEQVKQ